MLIPPTFSGGLWIVTTWNEISTRQFVLCCNLQIKVKNTFSCMIYSFAELLLRMRWSSSLSCFPGGGCIKRHEFEQLRKIYKKSWKHKFCRLRTLHLSPRAYGEEEWVFSPLHQAHFTLNYYVVLLAGHAKKHNYLPIFSFTFWK